MIRAMLLFWPIWVAMLLYMAGLVIYAFVVSNHRRREARKK